MKLFIKQFLSAKLRRSEDRCLDGRSKLDLVEENRIQITPTTPLQEKSLSTSCSKKEVDEGFNIDEDNLDLRALAFRQKSITSLKANYSRRCLAIIILSILVGILTVSCYRSASMDKRYLVKVGFILYQPLVAILFIYALRISNTLSYGQSMSQLRNFDYFGCQLILCLMAIDFFWMIAGLTGFMADPKDWLSLFLLVAGMSREVLYGMVSITSDRLVILCTVMVAPKPSGTISSFDRI